MKWVMNIKEPKSITGFVARRPCFGYCSLVRTGSAGRVPGGKAVSGIKVG